MGKFTITEEDKKHIMGLYEQTIVKDFMNSAVNTADNVKKNKEFLNSIYPEDKIQINNDPKDLTYQKYLLNYLDEKTKTPYDKMKNYVSTLGLIPFFSNPSSIFGLIDGIFNGNSANINSSILSLVNPYYSAGSIGIDAITNWLVGDTESNYLKSKREGIVNMSKREREQLFMKYGYGGYDKWVADGKPKL